MAKKRTSSQLLAATYAQLHSNEASDAFTPRTTLTASVPRDHSRFERPRTDVPVRSARSSIQSTSNAIPSAQPRRRTPRTKSEIKRVKPNKTNAKRTSNKGKRQPKPMKPERKEPSPVKPVEDAIMSHIDKELQESMNFYKQPELPGLKLTANDESLFQVIRTRMNSLQGIKSAILALNEQIDGEIHETQSLMTSIIEQWSNERKSSVAQYDELLKQTLSLDRQLYTERQHRATIEKMLMQAKSESAHMVSKLSSIFQMETNVGIPQTPLNAGPNPLTTIPKEAVMEPVALGGAPEEGGDVMKWVAAKTQSLHTQSQALQIHTAALKQQLDTPMAKPHKITVESDEMLNADPVELKEYIHRMKQQAEAVTDSIPDELEVEEEDFDNKFTHKLISALSTRLQTETTDKMATRQMLQTIETNENNQLDSLEGKLRILEERLS
ncbi:hypothetical protein PCE1_004771 [Barthelona sp. PCE]